MPNYGDFINVQNIPYNHLNNSRLVDHTIKINAKGQKIPLLNNSLINAIHKAQVPANFLNDTVELSTANRTQYKYIKKILKLMNVNFKILK